MVFTSVTIIMTTRPDISICSPFQSEEYWKQKIPDDIHKQQLIESLIEKYDDSKNNSYRELIKSIENLRHDTRYPKLPILIEIKTFVSSLKQRHNAYQGQLDDAQPGDPPTEWGPRGKGVLPAKAGRTVDPVAPSQPSRPTLLEAV